VERYGCNAEGVYGEKRCGNGEEGREECRPFFKECFVDLVASKFRRGCDGNGLGGIPEEG